jgi:hypothetical protein
MARTGGFTLKASSGNVGIGRPIGYDGEMRKEEDGEVTVRTVQRVLKKENDDNVVEAYPVEAYPRETFTESHSMYCSECYKLSPVIERLINENRDLLRKHFCPSCQSKLANLKRKAFDQAEKMNKIIEAVQDPTSPLVQEVIKKAEMGYEGMKSELQKQQEVAAITLKGLDSVEDSTGSGFLVTRTEMLQCITHCAIEENNELADGISTVATLERDYDEKQPEIKYSKDDPRRKKARMIPQKVERMRNFFRNVFNDRVARDRRTTKNIEEKGF